MKSRKKIRALVLLFAMVGIIVAAYGISNYNYNITSFSAQTSVNINCGSCLVKAEIRDEDDHDFVMDVTCYVKYLDYKYTTFNKNYILRLYFNKDLTTGDEIVIYGKYNTVPDIKNARIEDTNWGKIGGGEVKPKWDFYPLLITTVITPTDVFDISIDSGNPSSQKLYVNYVKCVQKYIPSWHDNETGQTIEDYEVQLNYKVTADGTIDTDDIYVDLSITQRIVDNDGGGTSIMQSLVEKTIFKVPSVDVFHVYISNPVEIIDHSIAGTDNITIFIDMSVTVSGRIKGSDDWVVLSKDYVGIREFTVLWY